jgi:hypothetical protein
MERNRMMDKIEKRFWKKVNKGGPDECWLWTASTMKGGYGQLNINKKSEPAHRLSYLFNGGGDVRGRHIYHICENTGCVNPAHLVALTHEELFWFNVKKAGEDECWEWKKGVDSCGYGMVSHGNRSMQRTHRVSYELMVGKIPEGKYVCHTCDNPLCVNPKHLFIGTQFDNMRDMINKGRAPDRSGENNSKARLTKADVEMIRKLRGKKLQREIGDMFGIKQPQVGAIQRGQSWR